MIKKRDLILIGICAGLAGLVLWLTPMLRTAPSPENGLYMRYQIQGQESVLIPLTEERELTIDQGEGIVNTFRLSPQGFAMENSTCKNQICVYQGEVTAENMAERPLYHMIVCAPHRLVAELLTAEEAGKTNHEE